MEVGEVPWIWEKLTLMDFGGGMVCVLFENVSPNDDCRSTLWRSVTGFEDMKFVLETLGDECIHHEWDVPRGLRRLYTLKESSTGGDWRNNISASLIEGSSGIAMVLRMLVDADGNQPLQEKRATTDRVDHFMYFQGGLSDGYKNSISEKELPDETYKEDGVALYSVQGAGPENMQAIQVEHVASSLSFSYCYILQNCSVFTWIGYLTTREVQELVEREPDVIKPNTRLQKEGVGS
ncbi:villin-4-like protein [Tanacetum coccineum]|uniref:Villin-4-like protein n=1 Tax=Tanacetum coccineum TaxID=301880 RepID=A0ABQ5CK28_9ASTR